MLGDIPDCRRLLETTRNLGGKPPAVLSNLIDSFDLVNSSRHELSTPPASDLLDAAKNGTLTAETVVNIVRESALAQAASEAAWNLTQAVEPQIRAAFHQELRAGAADTLLESLQPAFKKAADRFSKAVQTFPQDATAEQILALGDDTAAAWREAPTYVGTLEAFMVIARSLAHDFNLVGHTGDYNHPFTATVAFVTAPGNNPEEIARVYTADQQRNSRLRGWGTLARSTSLRLNTVTETNEVLRLHRETTDEVAPVHRPATARDLARR